jgi:NADH-quinone oxidoreductase subunit M
VAVPAHRVRRADRRVQRSRTHAHAVGAAANDEHHDDIHDVTIYEWIAWTPLLIAIVVLGVYPQLMFKVMDPAVDQLTAVFRK